MTDIVRFKSTPANWRKECLGIKPNTLRTFGGDIDNREILLRKFMLNSILTLDIEIENTETKKAFKRHIMDVTEYDNYYIISWEHIDRNILSTMVE